ncbi:GDP-mannose transporter [Saccharomycopsis crataegensis]|uniref:GDP-mannose transporter n=1 Tax=Saccharomycopsis crataegensis TaxID=43959 RepID=A0AAV5QVN6_9ASCO|nr:GDP-mannose transporter [Saccharomycopsis crataegensis]
MAILTSSIVNNGPVSILAYCLSSILMTCTNKYVVSGNPDFNLNFLLLTVQASVCILTLVILKSLGVAKYRPVTKEEAKYWSPISILLVVMLYTSFKALQYLAIPVYTIFKNLTIILIAYGEVLWFGGKVTNMALSSFMLMVASSLVAAMGDDKKSSSGSEEMTVFGLNLGYFWMFLNCFASAAFVLYMRVRIKKTNFKDFDTMFYNNLLSIPIALIATFVLEDWSPANIARNFPPQTANLVIFLMVFSGAASVGISYCSGWCIRVTSSTTYSMVGALNKLPIALSGLIFFDASVNFMSVISIFIGFAAGLVYAVAKKKQKEEESHQALPTTNKN